MNSMQEGLSSPIRVLVFDSDRITARLLAADLRRQERCDVECCEDPDAVVEGIRRDSPSVLLFSTRSREPAIEILALLRTVRSEFPDVRTIVLSEGCGPELVAEIFRAGAKGLFDREGYDPIILCRCIQCVADGQIWANSKELGFILDAFHETPSAQTLVANSIRLLTPRERDVVQLVADGFGNREVAEQLGLSTHTVRNYLFSIFDKIGISSRAELIMYVLSDLGKHSVLAPPRSRLKKPVSRSSRTKALDSLAGRLKAVPSN